MIKKSKKNEILMMEISYLTVDGRTAVILHIGDYLVDVFYTCRGVEYILYVTIFLGTTFQVSLGLLIYKYRVK